MNMKKTVNQRSTEWVKRLPEVVSALNNEVTRLTGKNPAEVIKEKSVSSKPATPYSRPVGLNEKKAPTPSPMFDICTSLVNWKGVGKGLQTRHGL